MRLPILDRVPASRITHLPADGGRATEHAPADWSARVRTGATRLPAGVRVGLTGTDAHARLCWFLAADLAGCATLVTDASWSRGELDAVCADARPAVFVPGDSPPPAEQDAPPRGPVGDADTPFYLPTTSGSSGRPRVLARTRESWLRSYDAFDVGIGGEDRVLVPGPLSSSLFLFAALHALHAGADLWLLDRWSAAEAAAACRHVTAAHLVPAMLAALLDRWERDPEEAAALPLRRVVLGGAHVDERLAQRLHRVLPGCELVEYYGAAETSVIAVGRRGVLHPVVDVHVDEGSGALRTRSPLLCAGRLRAGELEPLTTERGWFDVGDRAARRADGSLRILGRQGSTINTGGALVSAEEVEAVLRAVPGVRDAVVAGTPHPRFGELVTAVVEGAGEAELAAARQRAQQELKPDKRPRRWLPVRKLPRTASGKPARARVAELLGRDLPPEADGAPGSTGAEADTAPSSTGAGSTGSGDG
ncbi:AMP-binding protein [Salinifilum ghardaiensis]